MTALVWFRHDLRLSDHPALDAALREHGRVVPVFCFDDRLLAGRHSCGPRTRFLLECLQDLDTGLRERGARLVIRRDRPEKALVALARSTGASDVYYSSDVTPFARSRGRSVHAALASEGIVEHALPGLNAVDDVSAVSTRAGGPYAVFSPFYRTWLDTPRRSPLPAPPEVPMPEIPMPEIPMHEGLGHDRIPTADDLGLGPALEAPMRGGELEATRRLARFLDGPIHRYAEDRDRPDIDGTSRLSPYLHFGCLSPRAVEAALPHGTGPDQWRRQLCWRDFYHHVQFHNPGNAQSEYQERYRGTITWSDDDARFAAWTEGRTGFPFVDAGMRQLRREGWMHNRARLVSGSFLTKQLGIDWRRGERWFMSLLIDGDQANNNGNWQWIASVGVDPQPVFRRVYNPTLHLERHDPEGEYVREYVPELRKVPRRYLPEPWKMPESVQREAGCLIGTDYPAPVVDLAVARQAALDRYAAAAARS